MNPRPTGITLLALLFLLLGVLSFIWSLLVFGFGGVSSFFASIFTFDVNVTSSVWSGLWGMLTAVVQFAAGIALLQMKSWGWYLAVIGVGLTFVEGILGMFSGGIFTFICGCVGILIPAGILFYLLQPKIRDLFGIGAQPPKSV